MISELSLATRLVIVGLPTFGIITAAIGAIYTADNGRVSFWWGWAKTVGFISAIFAIVGIIWGGGRLAIEAWHWAITGIWGYP